jgi:hypothetical protein
MYNMPYLIEIRKKNFVTTYLIHETQCVCVCVFVFAIEIQNLGPISMKF